MHMVIDIENNKTDSELNIPSKTSFDALGEEIENLTKFNKKTGKVKFEKECEAAINNMSSQSIIKTNQNNDKTNISTLIK